MKRALILYKNNIKQSVKGQPATVRDYALILYKNNIKLMKGYKVFNPDWSVNPL